MNAVGLHDDVQTLLHEAGHCFHVFQTAHLPYHVMEEPPTEFCEVASMAMELLAAPYLDQARGGFYDARDAAQARREHLEGMLLFWPYMAVVDQFQHWVYQNAQSARDAQACDAVWFALWQRFMTVTDWSGLEEIAETGWHRKLHIYQIPFYYVEYGLAQLGSVQVYANSRRDPERALAQYKQALALGSTVSLPQLFSAAGAKFDPSPATLREAVQTVESALQDLTPA
jgi:oligoendopeptidase F